MPKTAFSADFYSTASTPPRNGLTALMDTEKTVPLKKSSTSLVNASKHLRKCSRNVQRLCSVSQWSSSRGSTTTSRPRKTECRNSTETSTQQVPIVSPGASSVSQWFSPLFE